MVLILIVQSFLPTRFALSFSSLNYSNGAKLLSAWTIEKLRKQGVLGSPTKEQIHLAMLEVVASILAKESKK